jgi:hypothetical protein
VNIRDLEPRRHAPPAGWPAEVFERLTDALATALVAAVQRGAEDLPAGQIAPAQQEAGA